MQIVIEGIDSRRRHIRITGEIIGCIEQRVGFESGRHTLCNVMDQRMILRCKGLGIFPPIVQGVEKRVGIATVFLLPQRDIVGQEIKPFPGKIRILCEIINRVKEHRPFDEKVIPQES
jgi:hypothetical protein